MASVTVDVHARLVDHDIRKATFDVQRHMQSMAQDAGRAFSREFAQGAERGSDRVVRAMDRSAVAVEKVQKAEERYQKALKSGDIEDVIAATNRLTKVRKDLASQDVRLHTSMTNLTNTLPGMAQGFDAASTSVGGLAQSFAGLGKAAGPGAIAGLVAGVGSLVGVAAQASGAIGVLPGVVAGAASAFGTLKIGLLGVDEALSALSDPEAFAEALKQLSPNAQQAALSLQQLMPVFNNLKTATQDALFANVGPQINLLANTLLPQIQSLTTGVAGGMNQMLSGVMGQLQTPATMTNIQTMIANIVTAFQNLAPAAAPFTAAITQLASISSSFMPQLASAVTEGANAFAEFIDNASRTGDLQKFIQGGIDAIGEILPMVGDLTKTFLSLAPVGEKILPIIGDGLSLMADIVPPLVSGLTSISPVFTVWEGGIKQVSAAFDAVKAVANGVIPVINRVTDAINMLLQPVRDAIALANALPGIDIPSIPQIGPITQIGSDGTISQGGGANASRERRGLAPVNTTAGLAPFNGAALPTGNWWGRANIAQPQGWNPQTSYQDHLSAINGNGSSAATSSTAAMSNVERMMALAQGANGGTYASASDLANGLADCSGAISDLVEMLNTGKTTSARLFTTTNFASDAEAAKLGFLPGYMPGALNVGVNPYPGNNGHMAATLPNGVNFESTGSGIMYGGNAAGALDPQFEKQYYRPLEASSLYGRPGSGPVPVSVESLSSGAAGALSAANGLQLDPDLGLSKGLPGLVENLFRGMFAGMLAPLNAQFAGQGPSGGLLGMMQRNNTAQGLSPLLGQPMSYSMPTAPMPGMSTMGGPSPVGGGGGLLATLGAPTGPFAPGVAPGLPGAPIGRPTVPAAGPTALAGAQQGYGSQYESRAMGQGGWQPKSDGGFKLGGLPMAAIQGALGAAGGAAGGVGGAGASAAAQLGIEMLNRTAQYGTQVAGIAASGLMETFSMASTELGDPSKGWLGRMIGGLAGAKPVDLGSAGMTETPQKQKDPNDAKQGAKDAKDAKGNGATVNIENFVQAENRNSEQTVKDLAFRTNAGGQR